MEAITTPFRILHDGQDFMVVNKAAGIDFHDDTGVPGLCSLISQSCGYQLFPVHRLDKPTSGLILLAKSSEAAAGLSELFQYHRIEKYYLAISLSRPKKKQGWVIGDMEKARRGNWKLCKSRNHPAITQFFSESLGGGHRAYILRPYSGKTHQLRVALRSISAPILGDDRYGCDESDRMYLHAFALKFSFRGKNSEFINPPGQGAKFLSAEFTTVAAGWQMPWRLAWKPPRQPHAEKESSDS